MMALVLMASMMTVSAQKRPRNDSNPQQRIERQLKQLDEKLKLTDDQEKQVKAIYEDFFSQQSSSRETSKTKRDEMNKKIESLLTEEQKKIFQGIKNQRMPGNRQRNR